MVTTKSIVTSLDKEVVRSIKDLSADNVEFENIYFGCKSITDADGIRFVRERTCQRKNDNTSFPKCSECREILGFAFNYCPNCGAKVVER